MSKGPPKASVLCLLDRNCEKFTLLVANYGPIVLLIHREVVNLGLLTDFVNIDVAFYPRKFAERFILFHLNTQRLRHSFCLF